MGAHMYTWHEWEAEPGGARQTQADPDGPFGLFRPFRSVVPGLTRHHVVGAVQGLDHQPLEVPVR